MHTRTPLLAACAAGALAGLGQAQTNNTFFDYNWASLSDGPPTVLLDPQLFGGILGLGDSIRYCYSIDVTQGGRNQSGESFISSFAVAQAFGGANPTPGVNIGQVSFMSGVSDDLGDDACFAGLFDALGLNVGTAYSPGDVNLGPIGLQTGTASGSINDGFFWTSLFEFIGSNLPSTFNTAGTDPGTAFPTPLLTHLVYEIQGPVGAGPNDRQYFLGSTSELNGVNSNGAGGGTGGVTNGNAFFGINQYLVDASQSGAVQGQRITIANGGAITTLAPLTLLGGTNGEIEWLGALAFQTPYLTGVNNNNAGGGGSDWVLSSPPLSTIDVRVVDKFAGASNPTSGSAIADPDLAFNSSFVLWSATPASTMLQSPMSWDDLGGAIPPQLGSFILGSVPVTRAPGPQQLCVNFDATTTAFVNLGFGLQTQFTDATAADFGMIQFPTPTTGVASLASGPITIGTANPNVAGLRLSMHSIGVELRFSTGLTLGFTEASNARTIVLQ